MSLAPDAAPERIGGNVEHGDEERECQGEQGDEFAEGGEEAGVKDQLKVPEDAAGLGGEHAEITGEGFIREGNIATEAEKNDQDNGRRVSDHDGPLADVKADTNEEVKVCP